MVNDKDEDEDGIPDYADRYNWDGIGGNDDDVTVGELFVPLVVEVPFPIDLDIARTILNTMPQIPRCYSERASNRTMITIRHPTPETLGTQERM